MEDQELEALRAKRMAEMQAKAVSIFIILMPVLEKTLVKS